MIYFQNNLTLGNLLTLNVYVLLVLDINGLQNSRDPCYEVFLFVFEVLDARVHLLMDLHGQLESKFVRQFVHEAEQVLLLTLVVVLDGP